MVDFALIALYGAAGFWTANYILRNRWDSRQIAIAIAAGMAVSLVVSALIAVTVFAVFRFDTFIYIALGSIAGPSFAAVLARRWGPKALADNDLRAK